MCGDAHRGDGLVGATERARMDVIRQQLEPMDLFALSALDRDRVCDIPSDDDFSSPTLGKEIKLTLFPLAHGSYFMPYPFTKGESSSPPRYTSLTGSTARLQEKVKENKDLRASNNALFDEVRMLKDQLIETEVASSSAKSESQRYKDMATVAEKGLEDLRSDVTRFVISNFDGHIRKLLFSDEFNAILVHILSLGINSGVERGLRMTSTPKDSKLKELPDDAAPSRA
ncbi:hypothetical protein Tco_0329426 [Tanacetum coccineum]